LSSAHSFPVELRKDVRTSAGQQVPSAMSGYRASRILFRSDRAASRPAPRSVGFATGSPLMPPPAIPRHAGRPGTPGTALRPGTISSSCSRPSSGRRQDFPFLGEPIDSRPRRRAEGHSPSLGAPARGEQRVGIRHALPEIAAGDPWPGCALLAGLANRRFEVLAVVPSPTSTRPAPGTDG